MRGPSYTGRSLGLGGRYAVGELLGEGGWGAVYAATQTDLGRKVALKILHTDVALSSEAVSRFEREAKAAASFGHPNIVQVTDFQANPNEPPFLVMEHLTGSTLGAILQRQVAIPQQRMVGIAFQMLSALDVAHRAGLVHRDVKPDNIFLVSMPGIEDFVKLLDFGIAKLSAENQAQLTGDGQMLGSPAFMSPEQVRSQAVDHRADIYAVGASMYYALSGRLPFDASNVAALLAAIMEQQPRPLLTVAPSIDPRLATIIERCLHKDPFGRFGSAAEMRASLEPWIGSGAAQRATPGVGVGIQPATMESVPSPLAGIPKGSGPTAGSPISSLVTSATGGPYAYTPGASGGSTSPNAMSMGAPSGPPLGTPPPNPYGPSYPAYPPTLEQAKPAQKSGMSGAVLGLLIAIVGLLVIVLLGGAGFAFYMTRGDASSTSPAVLSSGAAPPSAVASAPAVPATASATPTSTSTSGALKKPGPAPTPGPGPGPTPVVIVDAGGGNNVTTIDAGARKQYAGAQPRYGGGAFDKYDIEKSKEALNRVMPQLGVCYAATEFDPPDHQFVYWTLTIDPAGNVTNARRTTDALAHPKLDACVIPVLKTMKWQALPGGGTPQVNLTARTRDNP